jgi:hypothetical protein
MKFLKIATTALCLSLAVGVHANESKPFACATKLDYVLNGEVKTIDLKIVGERSQTNTLAGQGVFVTAGAKTLTLNLPAVDLSDDIVYIKGTNTKEKTTVELAYLGNSDGSQNLANRASVAIRTNSGIVKATTEILSTEDGSDAYEVNCEITK